MKDRFAYILGGSIIIASVIFGSFYYQSKQEKQSIKVVGYAVDEFDSDLVKWSINLTERVGLNGLQEGYQGVASQLEKFQKIWASTGLSSTELKINPVNVNNEYGNAGQSGYSLTQRIIIVSKSIDEIEKLAINPHLFVSQGVTFSASDIEFFSSALDDIKIDLLSEATKNARERAEKIVALTDTKIDKLISARAGVFQITEPLSTEVAGYGVFNTSSRKKNIKVTVSADYSAK
jgi:hypothetical protein